ncbi:hypothetical protein CEXT_52661 [Caerostris extrusa]|uniref:Uncharacterized protein n=1 Tax=Caerostris extrusa TaxID=172846 RepID=A0AAV4TPZ4_CAEEX|nr:hypothetical protein CEXT_52661 [Caerostris extrusa]
MGKATTYRKRCLKYGGRVITFIRNRVHPKFSGGEWLMSIPSRTTETKVMIPFPGSVSLHLRYPHLGPAASFGKCMS